jgi:hypothetical protein
MSGPADVLQVMVWFGRYGPATQPIGMANGALATEVAGGVSLYAVSLNPTQHDIREWLILSQ